MTDRTKHAAFVAITSAFARGKPMTATEVARLLDAVEASGAARPTPVEPEARDDDDSALHCGYFAPCEQEADHDGPHTAGMYPEWQVPTIEPISFDHPARRLAVEPDGLPLEREDGKFLRPGWHYPRCWQAWSTAWHPTEWDCICANIDGLASTPSEAKP